MDLSNSLLLFDGWKYLVKWKYSSSIRPLHKVAVYCATGRKLVDYYHFMKYILIPFHVPKLAQSRSVSPLSHIHSSPGHPFHYFCSRFSWFAGQYWPFATELASYPLLLNIVWSQVCKTCSEIIFSVFVFNESIQFNYYITLCPTVVA